MERVSKAKKVQRRWTDWSLVPIRGQVYNSELSTAIQ
jgi:hypothetical protein